MEWTQNSRLKPMTFTCDLDLKSAWLSYGFCTSDWGEHLTKVYENLSKGSGDMEQTRKCYGRTDGRTDGQTQFDQSLEKILPGVKEIQSGHEIQGSNPWPWTVTLTLSRHGWVLDSAHHLTKVNIWPKFKENPSTGIKDTERTQNSRLKPMTLTCDLDLELAWLTYWFCTLTHWGEHLTKV